MVDANRPEIGFVFDVDDRASRQLDRIADQMERIDRAQRGIAGGAGRVGGQALADEYRGGAAGGTGAAGGYGGAGGYQQQTWSEDPEVRRLQQEQDARIAEARRAYATDPTQDPRLRNAAVSPAYSDRDFQRELDRHNQMLKDTERRKQINEDQYQQRQEARTKEWEQREADRHKNQLERDRKRVLEFEESQKRLRGHMYGSNFAGEFLAELGFVIFEQFQQGVQTYAAEVDAEGYQYSGAGGELAAARRFQSRFGQFQTLLGEGAVGAGGALENIFGTMFESGDTTSRREFTEGLGRSREELHRIAQIDASDGIYALTTLFEQIQSDTLDPAALGQAVNELERLSHLQSPGSGLATQYGQTARASVQGGMETLNRLGGRVDWENPVVDPTDYFKAADPLVDLGIWGINIQGQQDLSQTMPDAFDDFKALESRDITAYREQIELLVESMKLAGYLTTDWGGNLALLKDALMAAGSSADEADQIIERMTKTTIFQNRVTAEAAELQERETRHVRMLNLGITDLTDSTQTYAMTLDDATAGIMLTEDAISRMDDMNRTAEEGLKDHTNEVQHYRAELDYMRQSFGQFQQDSRDDLNLRLAAHLNGDIPLSPDDLDELNQKLRRLGELDSTQVDMIFNMKLNYSAVGAAQSELAGIAAGFGDPLAESGRSWMLNIGNTPTTNKSTGSGFGRSSGGGGSSKKTPEQAWIEERTKLLQDGATMAEVAALEMAFYADYDKEAWEKDYDQPGYLTEYGAGVKRINDRIQAAEDQADVNKEGYEALSDIDKQIGDLRVKGEANKGMLDDFDSYESYQAQIEQLEKQKEILEEHLEQGTLTTETLENIEEQSEFWAERNHESLERMTDKVNEMKEELKEKFDQTIKALNTRAALELAGQGGERPANVSPEEWRAAEMRNAMKVELAFAQASLAEAERFGDPEQIAIQKRRVATVQANLAQAEKDLAAARERAEREGMTAQERVREDLGDQVGDSSSEGYVSWTDPNTGIEYHSNPTNAYIRSRGITDLNSEEAIAIRRGITTANFEQGADFNLGDSADASAEEALQYWTQSQSGSAPSGDSSSSTQVTINLGDGTTIQSSTAEVIVEEQG